MYGPMRATVPMLVLMIAATAMASGINGINSNAMPNRISMNVTVPKQTRARFSARK